MYDVMEMSLGNLSRLYQYMQNKVHGAAFNLKGFDYAWLTSSREWRQDEKVLDVGAAYSPLPIHIRETFGSEVWVVDDFGLKSDLSFWARNRSPQEFVSSHPQIKYVLERLGDQAKSSLPAGYFDVVYSISVLEHIPQSLMESVWQHMDSLLKPGGEMLHAIDLSFPSNRGLWKLLGTELYDAFYVFVPHGLRVRHCMATPKAYTRLALSTLSTHHSMRKELSVRNMVLDPDILTEGYEYGINRITKDGMKDYRYQRTGTLLLHLRKKA